MLTWTPWALPGFAALFGGPALALFIYRARPDREQNRHFNFSHQFEQCL